jgi:hypothetical protein
LAAQAIFDLSDQRLGYVQRVESLVEDLGSSLRLLLIALKTRMRFEPLALSDFGPVFDVSFAGSHRELLRPLWGFCG